MVTTSDFVECQKIYLHPCFNVHQAGGEGGVSGRSDGLGVEVELSIICIKVKLEAMVAEDPPTLGEKYLYI